MLVLTLDTYIATHVLCASFNVIVINIQYGCNGGPSNNTIISAMDIREVKVPISYTIPHYTVQHINNNRSTLYLPIIHNNWVTRVDG